jgi:hypothetical protein
MPLGIVGIVNLLAMLNPHIAHLRCALGKIKSRMAEMVTSHSRL